MTPTLPPSAPSIRTQDRPPSHENTQERRNSPAWGEGRSQDGSRPPRKEFVEKPAPERVATAAEKDNQWRLKMRPDAPPAPATASPAPQSKEFSAPSSPASAAPPAGSSAPASRPRLNLQKRTVSQAEPSPALATGASDAKSSPFGAARPIDTAARDKEIEEKLKQRKEFEEKAREEKRAADEKGKEERRLAKESERAEKSKEKANGQDKDKGNGPSEIPAKNYQILRREAGDEISSTGDNDEHSEGLNGMAVDDKSVKPEEVVRDIRKSVGSKDEDPPSTSAERLEEEGWSTVSKPSKGRKGGNTGARAIAS